MVRPLNLYPDGVLAMQVSTDFINTGFGTNFAARDHTDVLLVMKKGRPERKTTF